MDRPRRAGASASTLRLVLPHTALRGGSSLASSGRRTDPAGGSRPPRRFLHLHVGRPAVDRSALAVPGVAGGRLPHGRLAGPRPAEDRCHRRGLCPEHPHGPAPRRRSPGRGPSGASVPDRFAGAVHAATRGVVVPVPCGASVPPGRAPQAAPPPPGFAAPPGALGELPRAVHRRDGDSVSRDGGRIHRESLLAISGGRVDATNVRWDPPSGRDARPPHGASQHPAVRPGLDSVRGTAARGGLEPCAGYAWRRGRAPRPARGGANLWTRRARPGLLLPRRRLVEPLLRA